MATKPAVRVVVQHGNRMFRELLAENLARVPGVSVVGTVPSRTRLAEVCEGRTPDVAVFEAGPEECGPLPAPVRLVGLGDGGPGARAAGTTAVVPYGSGLRVLLDVIKRAGAPVRTPSLTTRERQVLCLICAGHTPREAAAVLGISPRTVENHKQQIFAKLDVHSQAHAVAHAVRLGLVGAPAELPGPYALSLTRREREILAAIGSGHTTRQTASELGISARTVENLQGALFRKLRVHTRTAALVAARDLRLIEV
jgi:DNA-binding CsgD family transcriptional regulator